MPKVSGADNIARRTQLHLSPVLKASCILSYVDKKWYHFSLTTLLWSEMFLKMRLFYTQSCCTSYHVSLSWQYFRVITERRHWKLLVTVVIGYYSKWLLAWKLTRYNEQWKAVDNIVRNSSPWNSFCERRVCCFYIILSQLRRPIEFKFS